jgi:hypothetical protein
MARGWCKHYSYALPVLRSLSAKTGPHCAIGCDLSAPSATAACLPNPTAVCAKRENWTDEEKATWEAWKDHHMQRLIVCMTAIPNDGWGGQLPCPACGTGTISWSRARVNKHLHASCSTVHCFGVMQ